MVSVFSVISVFMFEVNVCVCCIVFCRIGYLVMNCIGSVVVKVSYFVYG